MQGHFRPGRVRSVTPVADDVRLIEIEPEGGAEPYPTGSHLDLSVVLDGLPDTRSYSLVGERPADGAYRIAVKRLADSRGGSDVHAHARAGRRDRGVGAAQPLRAPARPARVPADRGRHRDHPDRRHGAGPHARGRGIPSPVRRTHARGAGVRRRAARVAGRPAGDVRGRARRSGRGDRRVASRRRALRVRPACRCARRPAPRGGSAAAPPTACASRRSPPPAASRPSRSASGSATTATARSRYRATARCSPRSAMPASR